MLTPCSYLKALLAMSIDVDGTKRMLDGVAKGGGGAAASSSSSGGGGVPALAKGRGRGRANAGKGRGRATAKATSKKTDIFGDGADA